MATIEQNLNKIIQAKSDIKTSIENKGITVGDISISEYSKKIDEITGGGGEVKQKLPNGMTLSGSTFTEIDMNQWDWSDIYDWSDMFNSCNKLENITFPTNQKIKVLDATWMFYGTKCKEYDLTSFDFSECFSMKEMFRSSSITILRMAGSVDKLEDTTQMFFGRINSTENGYFYYDSRYDYSKIIEVLPSNWEAIPY